MISCYDYNQNTISPQTLSVNMGYEFNKVFRILKNNERIGYSMSHNWSSYLSIDVYISRHGKGYSTQQHVSILKKYYIIHVK